MKYRILAIAFISFIGINAQERTESDKPKDKIVETTTKTITVMENGKKVQKKVMIRTSKEQAVKTDPKYAGAIDAPRVFPDTKIKKVIYIDNDNDPFYDKKTDIVFYKKNGMEYNFKPTITGFEIFTSDPNKKMGTARYSNNSKVYLLNTEDYSGIGYFENDQFVIEYYDDEGTLIIERFNESEL